MKIRQGDNAVHYSRPAVILGLSANGLSVARSLGRKKALVIGLDRSPLGPAAYSRYVKKVIGIPPPEPDWEAALVRTLVSLSKDLGVKPVLFPTADEYVLFLSVNRVKLSDHYEFIVPEHRIVETFLDKKLTSEFCLRNNILHPTTFNIESDQQWENALGSVKFPCIVKPQDSHLWRKYFFGRKVIVVNNEEELIDIFHKVSELALKVMVQQVVPGADSDVYQYLAFCDRESNRLASFCCHKIRQYPPNFGIACLSESAYEPTIAAMGEKILDVLKYQGMIALEFKFDQESKQPVFIEANLRTSYFGELAVAAGVDFPDIIYSYLVFNSRLVRERNYKLGVKLWNMELDLGCLSRLRKSGQMSTLDWINGLKAKKITHTYLAFDDYRPWVSVYSRLLRTFFSKIFYINKKKDIQDSIK